MYSKYFFKKLLFMKTLNQFRAHAPVYSVLLSIQQQIFQAL